MTSDPQASAMPHVAVVVVNWNSYDTTSECLRSLVALEYPHTTIILVDNGSDDGSLARLEAEFPGLVAIRHATNLGWTGAINAGFRRARELGAAYFMMLNNDTVVAENLLDRLVAVAESDPRIGALNPTIYHMHPHDRIWHGRGRFNWWTGTIRTDGGRREVAVGSPSDVNFLTGGAMLVRATALDEVGLLDDRFFIYFEDVDLTTRLRQAGYRAVYVPSGRVWHQVHGDVKKNAEDSFRIWWTTRNRLLLMHKHGSAWNWATFLPWFAAWFVGARIAVYVARGQTSRIPALFGGVRSYLKVRRETPQEAW